MTGLALVDQLRALPPPLALSVLRQLESELGPEGPAALETAWEFWRRPAQRFPTPHERPGTIIYAGGYGTGKTRTAWELLHHLAVNGRAKGPRIIAATGAAAREIVEHKINGILAWARPGVEYLYEPSKGYEGQVTINGVTIDLMSIEAPRAALGSGRDVQLLDDPPKWGATGKAALVAALKSARERGALTIIPTTDDGLVLIGDVMGVDLLGPGAEEAARAAGILVIQLGNTEANAGNLDPTYFVNKANMIRAGTWDPLGASSPWSVFTSEQWRGWRLDVCPSLVELAVAVDPSKGGSSKPCEVGVVGGGRDASDIMHVRHDRSGVLAGVGPEGWPAVAWQLAEDLHREHPRAPFPVFVLETNVGKGAYTDLLYAEEVTRRLRRGEPGVNFRCRVAHVRADRDKCVRAEAPANVAGRGQVRFAPGLEVLQGQLRNLTPKGTDSDRADACNHLLTHLGRLGGGEEQVKREVVRAAAAVGFRQMDEARSEMTRVDFDLSRA